MSYQGEIAKLVSEKGCNPDFWLRTLSVNIHISECSQKKQALQNAHDRIKDFIEGQTAIATKADAEIAALKARIRELTEWRAMETAPKDGTEILLCRKLGRLVIVGLWHDGHDEWIDGEYIAPIACPDFWIPISELPWLPGSEAA